MTDEQHIKAVHAVVKSAGWAEVEKVMRERAARLDSIAEVDMEGLSNDEIALELRARKRAKQAIDDLIASLAEYGGPGGEEQPAQPVVLR